MYREFSISDIEDIKQETEFFESCIEDGWLDITPLYESKMGSKQINRERKADEAEAKVRLMSKQFDDMVNKSYSDKDMRKICYVYNNKANDAIDKSLALSAAAIGMNRGQKLGSTIAKEMNQDFRVKVDDNSMDFSEDDINSIERRRIKTGEIAGGLFGAASSYISATVLLNAAVKLKIRILNKLYMNSHKSDISNDEVRTIINTQNDIRKLRKELIDLKKKDHKNTRYDSMIKSCDDSILKAKKFLDNMSSENNIRSHDEKIIRKKDNTYV